MELSTFKKNKKKKQRFILVSIGLVLLVAGIILYRTYSLFEESGEYDVIKGSVPEYIDNYDVKVNFKVDGVSVSSVPDRNSGKGIESIICDKGAIGVWDYISWNFNVKSLNQTRTTCTVNFISRYIEDDLHGTDPVIQDELIPVTIESNGTVHKANIQEKWYDYNNKEWANAVILKDKNIMYQNGEEIPEGNIESYFVWIPRYRYKIFDEVNYEGLQDKIENRVQTIEVEFEDNMQKIYKGSLVGEWLTHPAFTSFETNGMWVGKFETGYKEATSTTEAQQNVEDSSKIQIKPNVYSWRGINVANAFYSVYNYKREMNSHMMKNTEWGAIAYLSHSKYGSQTSVRINNNSAYLTGYSAVNEPTCGYTTTNIDCNKHGTDGSITKPWNTATGILASTTGNITGVYDMSGGAWEYVMGVMATEDGVACAGREAGYTSGFEGPYCYTNGTANGHPWPDKKYYDVYLYSTAVKDYRRKIFGDATGEMGPFSSATYGSQIRQISSWYNDEAWFVYSYFPWFARGGGVAYGVISGMFAFSPNPGSLFISDSFRVVLSF